MYWTILRRAAFVAAAIIAAIVLLFAIAGTRIASYVAQTYLEGKDVPALVKVRALSLSGARADVALGLGDTPDFAGTIEARFAWKWLIPSVESVTLNDPRVHAQFDGRTFSLGSLGHLIDVLRQGPSAGPTRISINVTGARVHVTAPQGALDLAADAHIANGNLSTLDARMQPGTLQANGVRLTISQAELHARGVEGSFKLDGSLRGSARRQDGTSVEHFAFNLHSTALRLGGTYGVTGPFDGDSTIDGVVVPLDGGAARLSFAAARFGGRVEAGAVDFHAALTGQGSVTHLAAERFARLVPVFGADPANVSAIADALAKIGLRADDVQIAMADGAMHLSLAQPLRLAGETGASLSLASGNISVFAKSVTGAFSLAVGGGGLPDIALKVLGFAKNRSTMDAGFDLNGGFSALPYRGAQLIAQGRVHAEGSAFAVTLANCAEFRLASFVMKRVAAVTATSAQICSSSGPVITGNATGWRFGADWRGLTGRLVAGQSDFVRGAGHIVLTGNKNGLSDGEIGADRVPLIDGLKQARYVPLGASGKVVLKNNVWRGTIVIATLKGGRRLGTVLIHHSMIDGSGSADIASHDLAFKPGGLQPADLSPLLSSLSQASGTATFTGKVTWTPRRLTSGGTLSLSDMDFVGPAGPVTGATATIVFTSLSPLATRPAQRVTVAKVGWIVPVLNVEVALAVSDGYLTLGSTHADMAGGTVSLDDLTLDLTKPLALRSTLHLRNFDLNALVSASNLSDKLAVDEKVSGAVPFSIGPKGIVIDNGAIVSAGPGRLSIARSVWSGTGANDAISDFAYQAMEHLAVDQMEGTVTSLPEGRLGLKLHILGRNDPAADPGTPEVNLFDLVQGHAFDHPLPLPKDTPVDLTLDTSLNFDELLKAYGGLRAAAETTNHPQNGSDTR